MGTRCGVSVDRRLRLLAGTLVVFGLFGGLLAAGERADGRVSASFTVTVIMRGDGDGWVRGPGAVVRCGIGTARTARDVCSQTVPEEALPYRLLAVTADDDSVEGPWTGCDVLEPNPSGQTCVIIEAGNRTVTGTINKRPPRSTAPPGKNPLVTALEKKAYSQVDLIYDREADAFFGIAGIAALATPTPAGEVALPVAVCSGIIGILLKGGSAVMGILASDPPDPRFRLLARPKVPPRIRVPSTTAVTPVAASALGRLIDSGLRLNEILKAVLTSVERAQGAAAANQRIWVVRQQQAAARHARAAATLLEQMAGLRGKAVRAIGRELVRQTPAEVRLARDQVLAQGLSRQVKLAFRGAGVTAVVTADVEREIKRAKPPVADVQFPAALLNPRVGAVERNAAKALRRLAARAVRTP